MEEFDLQITELWPGNEPGENVTVDWIEITNTGDAAWVSGTDPDLYYDDESQDPADAVLISGIDQIGPNESAIALVDLQDVDTAVERFRSVWSPVVDLTNLEIGSAANSSGLSQGGDGAGLFLGMPSAGDIPFEFEAYPDANDFSGQSWDVTLGAFSVAGENGAVATLAENAESTAAVGSPGDGNPVEEPTTEPPTTEPPSDEATSTIEGESFSGTDGDGFSVTEDIAFIQVDADNNADDGLDIGGELTGVSISAEESQFNNNANDGIDLFATDSFLTLFRTELAFNEEGGLEVDGVNNEVVITLSEFESNVDGLVIPRTGLGNSFIIEDSAFFGNSDDGIDVFGNENTFELSSTSSTGNAEDGIEFDGSFNTLTAVSSLFGDNGGDGFGDDITAVGNEYTLTGSSFRENGDDGFDIEGTDSTVILNNVSSDDNAEEGFEVDGSNNQITIQERSIFGGNGDDGFDIDFRGTGNTVNVIDSGFRENGDDGFDVFGKDNIISWSSVESFDNTEQGFEIDGSANQVTLEDSTLLSNGSSGLSVDITGEDNVIMATGSDFLLNTEDGVEILGDGNAVDLIDARLIGNGEWGLEVAGFNNTITLGGSTIFDDNGSGDIVLNGDSNMLDLGGLDITVVDNGSGNTILTVR